MIRMAFTPNLQRHVSCPPCEVEGATVREVLDRVFAINPRVREYVLDEQGALRKHINIFVNGVQIDDRMTLSDHLSAGSEVFIFQALSGG